MCGISLAFDRAAPPSLGARVLRMHARARHRGPDGEGFLAVGPDGRTAASLAGGHPAVVALAFRRLRILDLSEAADQPMAAADGRAWIAFNGEIFNYRALREELAAGGRAFRTTGDTEVFLAAYEAWGEGCFARLDGMWAAVIVDRARRRLVLSRDRFGIKPLHWALDGGALLVASEAKQILAARDAPPRANRPLLAQYLAGSRYPCLEETFFEGVRAVPPATWAAVPLDAPPAPPRFAPYWSLADHHAPAGGDYGAARERFRATFRDAVRSHAVADVTVGALLSGGLDSSSVAATLASVSGARHPTFSFGDGGDPRLDERPYAEAVARAHGLANHQAEMDADWVRAHAAAAIAALEEPPLAPAALAQYRTFQVCRAHGATVVLDGQGADEVLGGYPYHQRILVADRLRRGRLREAAREMSAIARRDRVPRARVAGSLALPSIRNRLRRPLPWLAAAPRREGDEAARARADRGRDPSALNRQLYWDVRWGNVKIVLGYTDRSAMAHSVEARVPFFDRALVELAFALPDHFKVGDGQRKRILRDVARSFLPAEVTDRPDRMGFAVPADRLMRALRAEARAAILDGGLLSDPLLDRPQVVRLLDRFAAGDARRALEVWRLYAAATWARETGVALG